MLQLIDDDDDDEPGARIDLSTLRTRITAELAAFKPRFKVTPQVLDAADRRERQFKTHQGKHVAQADVLNLALKNLS